MISLILLGLLISSSFVLAETSKFSTQVNSYIKARELSDFLQQNIENNINLNIILHKPYWSTFSSTGGCVFTLGLYDQNDVTKVEKYGMRYAIDERFCIVNCGKQLVETDKYIGYEMIKKGNQLTLKGQFKYLGDLEGMHQGYAPIGFMPTVLKC